MAKQPPEPRPPSPPPGFQPSPDAAYSPCFTNDAAFLEAVSGTVRNEWIRLRTELAAEGKIPPEEGTVINEDWLSALMASFEAGKVIPGYHRQADRSCEMFWQDLACFARWYAQLSGLQAQEIREQLADGVEYPWLDENEFGFPPPFDPCTDSMNANQRLYCCPEAVWTDSRYYTGSAPNFAEKKPPWALYGVLGGVALVATVAFVGVYARNAETDAMAV